MNTRGPGAGRALLALCGFLAATAAAGPEIGRAESVRVGARQFPAQEPPLADGSTSPGSGAAVPGEVNHPATPVVSIHVSYPFVINPGRELEYRIVVENRSAADAHHVRVRVPVPANSTFKTAQPAPTTTAATGELTWDLETLKGGNRREIVLVVQPTTGDDVACYARVSFEHGELVRTRIAKPSLRMRTTGPERGKLYEILTYAIEVTNTGTVEARDVVLTEQLPPGLDFSTSKPSTSGDNPLTWKLGTIAAGETRRVEFAAIPMQMGSLVLKATAAAAGGVNAVEANLSRVLVGDAKLQLVKTGPGTRTLDQPATYLLTVSNSGSVPASAVALTDELFYNASLRSKIEFLGASDDGKLVGNEVRWTLGALGPGSRRTVSMRIRHVQPEKDGGTFENVAKVADGNGPPVIAFTRTKFEPASGLTLDIEKAADPVAVGKTTTFTFRLREHDAPGSKRVALRVTLPEELQYVSAQGPSAVEQNGRTVTFAPLPELTAGAEAAYTVTVRAERVAEVKVRATVSAERGTEARTIERDESIGILPESANAPPTAAPDKTAPERGGDKEQGGKPSPPPAN